MKVYTYTEDDLGFTFGQGRLRFDEYTPSSPEDADVILLPICIDPRHGLKDIRSLPHVRRFPAKHVFLDVNDNLRTYPDLPDAMFIRCTLTKHMVAVNPRSRSMPWPVEDLWHCVSPPEGGFKYDVSFRGWASDGPRSVAAASCRRELNADIELYDKFYGYYEHTELGRDRRRAFLASLKASRFVLAPPSIYKNCFPYRFFEAMSAGRVPVMVGEGQVYPFPNKIDWDFVSIRIPSEDADKVGSFIRDCEWDDDEIMRRGLEAHNAWKTWLNPADWPKTHRLIVESML